MVIMDQTLTMNERTLANPAANYAQLAMELQNSTATTVLMDTKIVKLDKAVNRTLYHVFNHSQQDYNKYRVTIQRIK